MKKLFTLLGCATMVFTLTACSGNDNSDKDEENKVKLSETDLALEDLGISQGNSFTEVRDRLSEKSYTATYFYQGEDWSKILELYPEEDLAEYVVKGIKEIDPNDKTISIDLDTKTNIAYGEAENTLNDKLDKVKALIAVKKYGQQKYGHEFELNYIMDLRDASAEDENTWSFKVGATLDGEELTCDAKVTGTTDSPQVTSFDLY